MLPEVDPTPKPPPPRFGGGGGSTDSGSTFRAEVNWHKSGQVLHFGFKNLVLGPQHTFPLVAVLLESCGITIFPPIPEKSFFIGQFACGLCTLQSRKSSCPSGIFTVLAFGSYQVQSHLPKDRKKFPFFLQFST